MGERHYAFLRAINTGNRRLTNEQVLAPFVELGLADVAAYQAAGNVTFRAERAAIDERDLETALAGAYGFETPTFVRSAAEIAAIVETPPFTAGEVAATAGRVQVSFLRSTPSDEQVRAVLDLVPPEDRVRVIGREWYWLPVEGLSTSAMPVDRIERVLGEMTMRTLGTVRRMSAKFGG
jgi:uncharacterized protein (DUF1697 family)